MLQFSYVNKGKKKIFVLDTSVILYNHSAIYSFEENDVAIPITVVEELDHFKKGNDIKNFEAREFIRIMDKLSANHSLQNWIPIDQPNHGHFKVCMQGKTMGLDATEVFGENTADHRILNTVISLNEEYPRRKIVLVSKDINLRLKAKSLNISAEDFETGKIKNIESLYTGKTIIEGLTKAIIDNIYTQNFCMPSDIGIQNPIPNHYFILKSSRTSVLVFYNPLSQRIERIEKESAFRITPRNGEQVFALHAITNPNVKLVTLQGVAGTGKTLLALAGALDQKRHFKQIYLARPIVPLSNKDIGFLPGDIVSKLNPYMEPLWDNLKFIKSLFTEKDKEYKQITDAVDQEKLKITPLAYIRGRSISNVFLLWMRPRISRPTK